MTRPSNHYKYTQRTDYLADLVGADKAKDRLNVVLDTRLTGSLDVGGEIVPTTTSDTSYRTQNGAPLNADGTVTMTLSAPGADAIHGQVKSTGTYDVRLDWKDADGNVIRQEKIAQGKNANAWTDLDGIAPKSPWVDVVVKDTSGGGQEVNATANMV